MKHIFMAPTGDDDDDAAGNVDNDEALVQGPNG